MSSWLRLVAVIGTAVPTMLMAAAPVAAQTAGPARSPAAAPLPPPYVSPGEIPDPYAGPSPIYAGLPIGPTGPVVSSGSTQVAVSAPDTSVDDDFSAASPVSARDLASVAGLGVVAMIALGVAAARRRLQ